MPLDFQSISTYRNQQFKENYRCDITVIGSLHKYCHKTKIDLKSECVTLNK